MTQGKLFLVDASIYFFRGYFSLPPRWQSNKGEPTEGVFGYLTFLLKLLEEQRPTYIATAYDESLQYCFRNEIYPSYKANRALPDEGLAFQLKAAAEGARLLGIPCYSSNRYEADDIIATLVSRWRKSESEKIAILSRDKDLGQLLQAGDCLWDYSYSEPLGPLEVAEKVGVRPFQIPDYLALVGDPIDNIPGVPGIGRKTAVGLLNRYATVEAVLKAGDAIAKLEMRGAAKLPELLSAYAGQIALSKQLASLHTRVPLARAAGGLRRALQRQRPDVSAFQMFADTMGLGRRLLTRVKELAEDWIDENRRG